MTSSELLEYCMGKPGAEQSTQNQRGADQIKVGGVMFAMFCDCQGHEAVSLKTSTEMAGKLRAEHTCILPGEHLNKAHWNTVVLDGSLPDSQFYSLIDSSYQMVVSGLPQNTRHEFGL
ncbi:MmcQ/YjbR family DNA-binding protein [Rahnella sp. PCH160]|uniref:MmcQ/YjbR family DNA-binding protein n=1 Tax=Rahnella sp. PCH160 TaxID=3447928 RepID=UPI0039FD0D2E